MTVAYVSIGSNLDPAQMVPLAIAALRREFGQLTCSPVYSSAAVGFDGGDFLNLVCGFNTDFSPQEVNRVLHRIEDEHGRRREQPRFSDRSLDLDLLLHGDRCIDEDGLTLPRDEILRYAFVLRPLADLVPDLRHPVLGTRFADLWARFDATGQTLTAVELGSDPAAGMSVVQP